jgi:hypothetical protein
MLASKENKANFAKKDIYEYEAFKQHRQNSRNAL